MKNEHIKVHTIYTIAASDASVGSKLQLESKLRWKKYVMMPRR